MSARFVADCKKANAESTPPKNSALASASAELKFTPNWSLIDKSDGEFVTGAETYSGTGTLRYKW